MKANEIMKSVSRSMNKVGFKMKKHSPEILIVAGVAGTVASAIMACKATLKVNDILEDHQEQLAKINEVAEMGRKDYTEEDMKKDKTIVYTQTVVKLVKNYAPAIILGSISLAAMVKSNNILRRRNVCLAAAYAGLDKSFKEYRGRVIDRFGKELDNELRFDVKAKEFTTVDEKGKEKTEIVNVVDPNGYSDYAKFFDESCPAWTRNAEDNLYFLKQQQNYANDRLKSVGHLYLNEVYDMLGLPRTKAGQIVGWVYDEKNPIGDNFVDFGLYDCNREVVRDFVNGYERSILLDFNVDGNILDMI